MISEQLLISTVFIAGMLSFLSPCILPLLPVYVSILSTNENIPSKDQSINTISKWKLNPRLIFKTTIFVFGLSTSFVILGFGAGAHVFLCARLINPIFITIFFFGYPFKTNKKINKHMDKTRIIGGVIIIIMGIFLMTNNLNLFVSLIPQ